MNAHCYCYFCYCYLELSSVVHLPNGSLKIKDVYSMKSKCLLFITLFQKLHSGTFSQLHREANPLTDLTQQKGVLFSITTWAPICRLVQIALCITCRFQCSKFMSCFKNCIKKEIFYL